MADGAVEFLLNKISTLVENEVTFLGSVRQEFVEIKLELVMMKSFLKDAEARKHILTDVEKTWVKQINDVVYDVEDIIDEFMYYLGSRRQGFRGFIKKAAKLPKTTWMKHTYGVKLQNIKGILKVISESSRNYRFDHIQDVAASMTSLHVPSRGSDPLQRERDDSRYLKSNEIVGHEEDTELLLKWLMENEPQRRLISVVGMGGSGKTTLVSKIYKNDEVKRHFNCCAWVVVSQKFVIEDLCRMIIKELTNSLKNEVSPDLSAMDFPYLVEKLNGLLYQNRYLVVIDDVWCTDVWRQLRNFLPDNGLGSRILLTTREEEVGSHSFGVGVLVHHLQPLKEHEARSLFCKKAFYNAQCPPKMEEVAFRFVRKCKGLPLALVSLGGLMSTKIKLPSEWTKVYNSINWLLSNDPKLSTVKAILFLSYNDLPYHLKNCFLYCSIFPEDYKIYGSRLIRLWIAEGFIERRQRETLEDVAETYIEELISRSMLEDGTKDEIISEKTLKMHDIVRELAISMAKEQNLCTASSTVDQQDETKGDGYRYPRRLSLVLGDGDVVNPQSLGNISQLRSLIMFIQQSTGKKSTLSPSTSISLVLPPGFRLLRVLDLEDSPITCLPDKELGKMFNLHYLSLRGTKVKVLPKSIGKLQRLQTLDIYNSNVKVLPDGIVNCQNLRHLLAGYECESLLHSILNNSYTISKGVGVPCDIWKLKNLQVLSEIGLRTDGTTIKGIGGMTQLRKLEVTQLREEDVADFCVAIQQLRLLRHLSVMISNEDVETLRIENHLTNPPPLLHMLSLSGKLDNFPRWISSLNNLVYLDLNWSQLREEEGDDDPILIHISTLPCLAILQLSNAYEGKQLCFRKEWFPKLKNLFLRNLLKLNELVMEQGAISNLELLWIASCGEIKEVPHGIQHLSKLKELMIFGTPTELVERLRPGGADASKVSHVPTVRYIGSTPTGELRWEDLASSLAP